MWEPLLSCTMIKGGGEGGGSSKGVSEITIEKNPTMVENSGRAIKRLPPSFCISGTENFHFQFKISLTTQLAV